jgi:uncharacterized protein (TIGR02611 family)
VHGERESSAVKDRRRADPPARASATPASPGLRDRYLRRNRTTRLVYKSVIGVIGSLVIVAGVVLLPLPGPGWLIIFVGLGILASEFEWAARLLAFAKQKVFAWTAWVGRQSLLVRALIGLGCVAIVAAAVSAFLWWQGVPGWVPEWVPLVEVFRD